MDFNSGRFPLDLFSFYLDMSSEDVTEENTLQLPSTAENEQPANSSQVETAVTQSSVQGVSKAGCEAPTSSPSTEESVSNYVERKLQEMGQQPEAQILPHLDAEKESLPPAPEIPKTSVSDAIIKAFTIIESLPEDGTDVDRPEEEMSETGRFKLKADFFQTDTSEVKDLYDNAGADTTANNPTLVASTLVDPDGSGPEDLGGGQIDDISSLVARARLSKDTSSLTVPGRALLKNYFAEAPTVRLPIGHRTLALSEPQVHTLLKVVSDEAVASSLRTVQALVSDTLRAGGRLYSGAVVPRGTRQARSLSESSGDDPSRGRHTTDGYTSEALSSDDEFFARQVRPLSESINSQPPIPAQTRPEGMAPSQGFTASDYQPLSQLCSTPERPSPSRPARKRRRLAGSTGKVMKEAYFKGIKWTKTFVTGPLDPEHNRHMFYCQICKTHVSIFSKGAREIIRHYQTELHLRKDQRW